MLSKLLFTLKIGLTQKKQSMTTICNSTTSSEFKRKMNVDDANYCNDDNYCYYYYYYYHHYTNTADQSLGSQKELRERTNNCCTLQDF